MIASPPLRPAASEKKSNLGSFGMRGRFPHTGCREMKKKKVGVVNSPGTKKNGRGATPPPLRAEPLFSR